MIDLKLETRDTRKVIDIYDIIDTPLVLEPEEYEYDDKLKLWKWRKKNGDKVLDGAYKLDNTMGTHFRIGGIGMCILTIYFEKGVMSAFTLFDNKRIVCWEHVDGSVLICTVERLVSNKTISEESALYLRMKYEYHPSYYLNINSA